MKLFSWVKIDFIGKFQWRWMELKRDTGTVDGYTVYTQYQNTNRYHYCKRLSTILQQDFVR